MARAQDATAPSWGPRMSPLQKNPVLAKPGHHALASYHLCQMGTRWGGWPPAETSQERRET